MAFPAVKWCVICEDLRREQGGLVSLLGFYGVVPDAEVVMPDSDLPIDRLCFFLLMQGEGDGEKHRYVFRVSDPTGREVLTSSESTSEPGPVGVGVRTTIAYTFMATRFPLPGAYRITFNVDGREHFSSRFTVRGRLRRGNPAASS